MFCSAFLLGFCFNKHTCVLKPTSWGFLFSQFFLSKWKILIETLHEKCKFQVFSILPLIDRLVSFFYLFPLCFFPYPFFCCLLDDLRKLRKQLIYYVFISNVLTKLSLGQVWFLHFKISYLKLFVICNFNS